MVAIQIQMLQVYKLYSNHDVGEQVHLGLSLSCGIVWRCIKARSRISEAICVYESSYYLQFTAHMLATV